MLSILIYIVLGTKSSTAQKNKRKITNIIMKIAISGITQLKHAEKIFSSTIAKIFLQNLRYKKGKNFKLKINRKC